MVCFGRQDVGPFAGWELGELGARAGAGRRRSEEGGRGRLVQNGAGLAGLIPRGPRVTLADALLATEQCETEKDAVGGGPGLEPRPGPADGRSLPFYKQQHSIDDGQQTSE